MIIGIDLRPINLGSSGGMAQHVKNLFETGFSLYPDSSFIVYCTVFNRSLLDGCWSNVNFIIPPLSSYYPDLGHIVRQDRVDVLIRTYPVPDFVDFPLHRQIYLMPDIQHEYMPEFFPSQLLQIRRDSFNQALAGAGAIGTNTHFTRKTILDHPKTVCSDVFLITPALQKEHQDSLQRDLLDDEEIIFPKCDFFYFPANLWPHKNHRRLISAFRKFVQHKNQPFELICTGHPEGWQEIIRDFPNLPVRHLGFVRPQLVRLLFEKARALVFFSLYEGFGMPLLEAFDAGTPVICSNTTSLPEVGGDAILSCDPLDEEAMGSLMQRIDSDEDLRQELISNGRRRLKLYNWDQSAHNLYNACQRVSKLQELPAHNPQPKVTIVTPSFNQGGFIQRTIESVINQTYPNIEYFVIDGGSKDETVDILKSYGNKFEWVSEPDKGHAHAINKGFSRGHGEVLAFINSDDILELDAVAKVVAYFNQNPQVDILYGEAYYIDAADHVLRMYPTKEFSFDRLMEDCFICQPATFWRASIAQRCGPFDESLKVSIDYEYWLRMARAGGRFAHIPDILARSREYPQTLTRSERERIYATNFRICLQHGGYVHMNHFFGLWNHRIWERGDGIYRLLRFPKSYILIAIIHHAWFNFTARYKAQREERARAHIPLRNWVRFGVKLFLIKNFPWVRSVSRRLRALRYEVNEEKPVVGFWPDNFFSPVTQVLVRVFTSGQDLFIQGYPCKDTRLRVLVDHKETVNEKLVTNKEARIGIKVAKGQKVMLLFSDYLHEADGRQVAFRVTSTNLFTEVDAFH
jgi:glycosyltransferase involved in cell wall biosynthesis